MEELLPYIDLAFPAICTLLCYYIKSENLKQLAPLITELKLHNQIIEQQTDSLRRHTKTFNTVFEKLDDARERVTRLEAKGK